MKKDIELFQKIKECEEYIILSESHKNNITDFFVKNTYLKQKYVELLSKSYHNLFYINVIILMIIILIQIVELLLTIFLIKQPKLIIFESITIFSLLILFILIKVKKISNSAIFPFVLTWLIYFQFCANSILSIYLIKESQTKKSLSFRDISLVAKFYFYFISSHIVVCLFLQVNMSLHFGHFYGFFGLDVLFLILLNITYSDFYYESLSLLPMMLFTLLQSYKFEKSAKTFFDFCVRNFYSYLINEEIVQNANIGICLTKQNFEIKKMNSTFMNEMGDLINEKVKIPVENEEKIMNKTKKESSDFDDSKAKLEKGKDLFQTALKSIKGQTFNSMIYNNEKEKKSSGQFSRYLLSGELVKKEEDEKNNIKKTKISLLQALNNEANKFVEKGKKNDMEYFNFLGKFQISKNFSLYNVKWKRVYAYSEKNIDISGQNILNVLPNFDSYIVNTERKEQKFPEKGINLHILSHQEQTQENNSFNYKFIFTEITKNRKSDRIKVEQIYQKLILAKISHEFNRPIELIQNSIDVLMNEVKKSNRGSEIASKCSSFFKSEINLLSEHSLNKEKVDINLDEIYQKNINNLYLEIKFYAETITLSIRDLIEYINIHSANPASEEKEFSFIKLSEMKEYIHNLTHAYIELMEKPVTTNVFMESCLEGLSIEIEVMKFNQILSNLISNAIKNIDSNDAIFIRMNKMSPRDIKYFEFGADRDLFINNEQMTKPVVNQNNTIDESENKDVELGLVIQIEDTGNGINETLLRDINIGGEEFYRIDTNDTKLNNAEGYMKCKGLGSGLKICKKLADEMGVKLKCKVKNETSNPGTIFYIYIKTELLRENEVQNLNISTEEEK